MSLALVGGDGRVVYAVTGVAPILMHSPAGMSRTEGPGKKKIPTPLEEAEVGSYRLPNKDLYIPAIGFRNGILNATEGRKFGKTAAKRIFASALLPAMEHCSVVDPQTGEPIRHFPLTMENVNIQRAVVMGKGVLRARHIIYDWATTVEFTFDPDELKTAWITEIFERAGKIQGVLDQRPGSPRTPGSYGRYRVRLLDSSHLD